MNLRQRIAHSGTRLASANSSPLTSRAVDLISRNALASGFKPQTVG